MYIRLLSLYFYRKQVQDGFMCVIFGGEAVSTKSAGMSKIMHNTCNTLEAMETKQSN